MNVAGNLKSVRERIEGAAARASRDPREVKLIAVSKGRSLEQIIEAAKAGQVVFGENRAQELRDKLNLMDRELEWHFIGHLQRNKVNMVVGKAALIHSLDSWQLAGAVDHRARALGITQDVLLQVNISRETGKYGVGEDEVNRLLDIALALPGLRIRGLMTIAPLLGEEKEARACFVRLRELRNELSGRHPRVDMGILSMGMTQDFEIAVEEGANMVRVGTAVFAA